MAHPGKLRIIAESTRKSDKLDARVLAEFLARQHPPKPIAPRPGNASTAPWSGIDSTSRGSAQPRDKIRRVVSDYNADRRDLFTAAAWRPWRRCPSASPTGSSSPSCLSS